MKHSQFLRNSYFLIVLLISICHAQHKPRRILAVEFFGSKSHVITYLSLLEELAKKGDQVTLISPSSGLSSEPNITSIFTFSIDRIWKEFDMDLFKMKEDGTEMNPFTMLTITVPKYCREMYDRPDLQAIMSQEFDLILIQPLFNDCALGYVYKIMMKNPTNPTPLVLFSPVSAPNFVVELVGGYHPSSFVSNTFINYGDDMTFLQRFLNFGMNKMFDAIMGFYYLPVMEALYREKVGQDTPSAKEILSQASLILSNGHFSISRPKPNLPDVVDVGGIHSRKARPLPKELEDFVTSGSDDGFILFSLGTGLSSDKMSKEKRAIFLSVFSRLKQKVVWKYESDNIPKGDVPKNVLLTKWMPQQDLLGHPKIRLFMSHCGGGGTEEAIFHGVPMLGMPFFGDQPLNAQSAEKHGYLYRLDWNDLSEESLTAGIAEVINNPKYRESVQKLSRVFRDQVDPPLERGVFWLEYVMRHKGAPHLKSPARDLYHFQYHSLDVMGAYGAIIFGIIFLLFSIIKIVLRWCGCIKKNKINTDSKQKKS